MKHFENISSEERHILEAAVAQIAVLIAGADGEIDNKETNWASKLAHIRSYAGDKSVQEFYKNVEATFESQLRHLVNYTPKNTAEREAVLSEGIAKVNPILAKLPLSIGYHVYHSYITFAKSVAKSEGGILGFGTISQAEQKLIGLNMITPISRPKEDLLEQKNEEEES